MGLSVYGLRWVGRGGIGHSMRGNYKFHIYRVFFFNPGDIKTPTITFRINFFYKSLISCLYYFLLKYILIGSIFVLFPLHSAINKGMWLALCPYFVYLENFLKKVGVKKEEKK